MSAWVARLKRLHWFDHLHHVYVVLAVLGALGSVFASGHTAKEVILLIALLVYFFVLLIVVIFFSVTNGKKARYAEALACMHEAIHQSRDIYHRLDWALNKKIHYEHHEFKNDLVRVLTSAVQAFNLSTGVKCRLCIKVVGIKDNAPEAHYSSYFVTTLARDGVSNEQCLASDKREGQSHLISDNTDFNLIIKRVRSYFFSNDVLNLENYENSSFQLKPENKKYRSTIVWPIRYVYCENEHHGCCREGKDQDIYGFLAVDSNSRQTFSERYDTQLGLILADALFSIFDTYRKYRFQLAQGNGGLK
ncbi:hypothetical protein [Geomonas limicola]|uniref:hypothetical protein n=1 Tax=Geomonas limicola TaxID=2740186 RepID=UPI001609367D|nr:hypothetical protein [Geomonas limicola]